MARSDCDLAQLPLVLVRRQWIQKQECLGESPYSKGQYLAGWGKVTKRRVGWARQSQLNGSCVVCDSADIEEQHHRRLGSVLTSVRVLWWGLIRLKRGVRELVRACGPPVALRKICSLPSHLRLNGGQP